MGGWGGGVLRVANGVGKCCYGFCDVKINAMTVLIEFGVVLNGMI